MNSTPGAADHALLWLRRNLRPFLLFASLLVLFLLVAFIPSTPSTSYLQGTSTYGNAYEFFGGAVSAGKFSVADSSAGRDAYHLAAVADLDKRSKHDTGKEWYSIMTPGVLRRTSPTSYDLQWTQGGDVRLSTKHNEGGRGMEVREKQSERARERKKRGGPTRRGDPRRTPSPPSPHAGVLEGSRGGFDWRVNLHLLSCVAPRPPLSPPASALCFLRT